MTMSRNAEIYEEAPIAPGLYPFKIINLEWSESQGQKTKGAHVAVLTLRLDGGMFEADITDSLILFESLKWKLCQFFVAIGLRKNGERFSMQWDSVIGKAGVLEIKTEEYTKKDGTEGISSKVARYLTPEEAAAANVTTVEDEEESLI